MTSVLYKSIKVAHGPAYYRSKYPWVVALRWPSGELLAPRPEEVDGLGASWTEGSGKGRVRYFGFAREPRARMFREQYRDRLA